MPTEELVAEPGNGIIQSDDPATGDEAAMPPPSHPHENATKVRLTAGNWIALTALALAPATSVLAYGLALDRTVAELANTSRQQAKELSRAEEQISKNAQTMERLLLQVERIATIMEEQRRYEDRDRDRESDRTKAPVR